VGLGVGVPVGVSVNARMEICGCVYPGHGCEGGVGWESIWV